MMRETETGRCAPAATPAMVVPSPAHVAADPNRTRLVLACGAVILAVLYTWQYLGFAALPGNQAGFPAGWWGWFDQSMTLESAQALARRDFAPEHHWYPLGYAIAAAPFATRLGAHPFFFVDLACLLIAYWGFVAVAGKVGIGPILATATFLFATASDSLVFSQWVIPWNTTPVAALMWLLLAAVASHLGGGRKPFWIGFLAALVVPFRPTEALLVLPCLAATLVPGLREDRLDWTGLGHLALGAAVPALPYALLYLRIYGPHPSEYMVHSRQLGFTLHDLGWKATVILLDPRAWFLEGEGLLMRNPWIGLAIAGLVPALLRGGIACLLAVLLVLHALLYLSYVDLLPTGFWRYNNVHYWTWAFPGYGLLAILLLRDLAWERGRNRRAIGWAALAGTAVVLCLRVAPVAVSEGSPAKMVGFPGPAAPFHRTYFGPLAIDDAVGRMENVRDMRAFPVPAGIRVVALGRPFEGEVAWSPGHAADEGARTATERWRGEVRLGLPCWLPLIRCRAH